MASLQPITHYCNKRTRTHEIPDYPGAKNGLQIENNGTVTHIGAAVDASLQVFESAVERGVDFLIVHHGPFWAPVSPLTGPRYRKFFHAMQHNLAVYGSHLPLDAHPEIGNNVCLAQKLGLQPTGQFAPYEGVPIGWYCDAELPRETLTERLHEQFPRTVAMMHGPQQLRRIGILTGSGGDALTRLAADGIDTLITGECSQHHFALSQELGVNLYTCGHYDTEVFAVQRLAAEVAEQFALPWSFIDSGCPL
ncbi:MAG: Nif3-like dinuclear metal center hexameric protein [Puniceicoccaceae bacterium]